MWPTLPTQEWLELSHEFATNINNHQTCGQCGKTFNRTDNLAKHLKHCTGHRQLPPPPQQQQTAAPPPPKFTIHHQYSSMGGAVERYSINMQETQHLDHLSTSHHLLPSMKTFHIKHHAYKFQVVITIVCQKAVDPSVVTQPPVTLTSEIIAVYAADTAPPVDDINRQLLNFVEVIELNGSGWVFSNFQSVTVDIMSARPFTR